jgi:enoyl-CoA hydratase
MNPHVRTSIENGIGLVTIDRPEALNALDDVVLAGLEEAFLVLGRDPSVRAVVLTGTGKAFVAGADIKAMAGLSPAEARSFAHRGQRIFNLIEDHPHPVIAAVNGFALGGGLELAMTCDIRIASERAKVGQPEVNLGVLPGFGGTQRLSRILGRSAAKYLLFTGETVDARRALDLGLFSEVVAPEALMPRCMELAAVIASKAPVAVTLCKEAVNRGSDGPLREGLSLEADLFARAFATEDQKEGMQAFIEKRPARFQGQ